MSSETPPRRSGPGSPPEDAELEDFLAGRSAISAAYREAGRNLRAPAELEAPILAAAHSAPTPPSHGLVRRQRWLPLATAAAGLVLSLSVILKVWQDSEVPSARSRSPSSAPLEQEQTTRGVDRPPPAPEGMAGRNSDPAAGVGRAAAAVAPRRERAQKAAPPPSPPSPAAADFAAPAPRPEPTSPGIQDAEAEEARAGRSPTESYTEALAPEEQRAAERDSAAAALADPLRKEQAMQAMTVREPIAPEIWISRIEELRRRGEIDRVREELLRFCAQYPDQPLPAELRPLAPADQSRE